MTDPLLSQASEQQLLDEIAKRIPDVVITPPPTIEPAPPQGNSPSSGKTPLFVGDYSTGNFSQWPGVQCKDYNSSGSGFPATGRYQAQIQNDSVKGKVARFEVRDGDVPPFGGGERSEVAAGTSKTGGTEGQTLWYEFATKFDSVFADSVGWGQITNQWHGDGSTSSPPFSWVAKGGKYALVAERQGGPGLYLGLVTLWDTDLKKNSWHNIYMEVLLSRDDSKGAFKLWYNGARQNFKNGKDVYNVRSLNPWETTVYYKEGIYRDNAHTNTSIVYHTGFKCGKN